MPQESDVTQLERLLRWGPRPGRELTAALGCSDHALGRLLRAHPARFVRLGANKNATYGLTRAIPGVASPIPVYACGPRGGGLPAPLLELVPLEPSGFAICPVGDGPATHVPGLPWFLHDLRPSGYLGRRVPRALGIPSLPLDVGVWTADHVLRYLCVAGRSPPGALVVGEAMRLAAAHCGPPGTRARGEAALLAKLAEQLAASGDDPAVSSPGGEQPKALGAIIDEDGVHEVIVKFSPPLADPVGRRVADLLVAEQLAGAVIDAAWPGWAAHATAQLAHGRAWLLSRRFDREPSGGRRGCVSLTAADAGHCEHPPGAPLRWAVTARALGRLRLIRPEDVERICLLEAFGYGIGNTDMHLGNLCLGLRATEAGAVQIDGVMPIYDMLPMAWMPQGEVRPLRALPPAPPDLAAQVAAVAPMVAAFWDRLEADPRISDAFRAELGARPR